MSNKTLRMENSYDPYKEPRAKPSKELFETINEQYGIETNFVTDLGGSYNLNLLLETGHGRFVARLYMPYVTVGRLSDIQNVRYQLTVQDVPCSQVIATKNGQNWTIVENRLLEVERFVERDAKMDSWKLLSEGLPLLGRIHTLLRDVKIGNDGKRAPCANHVEADNALKWTLRGTQFIRAWDPTPNERHFCETAEELARLLEVTKRDVIATLPHQLVHGDFWDNNVFFCNGKVVFVADFDFMGERARIDDLALTLFYKNSTSPGNPLSSERIQRLRKLVDAYDNGLKDHLTQAERAVLPIVIARMPLSFVGIIPSMDSKEQGKREISKRHPDIQWALQIAKDRQRWQDAFL